MKNVKLVDKKTSIQVRLDRSLHQLVKDRAKRSSTSIKNVLEGFIIDGLKDETIQN